MGKLVIVCWPHSQNLMGKEGFLDHCSLINSENGLDAYGSSAYLVDKEWYENSLVEKSMIVKMKNLMRKNLISVMMMTSFSEKMWNLPFNQSKINNNYGIERH